MAIETTEIDKEGTEADSAPEERTAERDLGEIAFELATLTVRQLAEKRDELLAQGVPADALTERLWSDDVSSHVGELVAAGASAESIITALGRGWVRRDGVAKLLEAGIPAADLLPFMTTKERASQAPLLSEYGMSIDEVTASFTTADIVATIPALAENRSHLDGLFERCEPRAVAGDLAVFIAAGIAIDFDQYLPLLTKQDLGQHLSAILEAGAPVDDIVARIDPWTLDENVDRLLQAGGSGPLVLRRLARGNVASHITALGKAGVPIAEILERLNAWDVAAYVDELRALGADPEIIAPLLAAREIARPKS